MKEQLEIIRKNIMDALAGAGNLRALDEVRVAAFGKKGELTQISRSMGALTPEERPAVGQMVNALKEELETLIETRRAQLHSAELTNRLAS